MSMAVMSQAWELMKSDFGCAHAMSLGNTVLARRFSRERWLPVKLPQLKKELCRARPNPVKIHLQRARKVKVVVWPKQMPTPRIQRVLSGLTRLSECEGMVLRASAVLCFNGIRLCSGCWIFPVCG